jgi:hypothetical protein
MIRAIGASGDKLGDRDALVERQASVRSIGRRRLAVALAAPAPGGAVPLSNQCVANGRFGASRGPAPGGGPNVYYWGGVSATGTCVTPMGQAPMTLGGIAVNPGCGPSVTASARQPWNRYLVTITVTPLVGAVQRYSQQWLLTPTQNTIEIRKRTPALSRTVLVGGPTGVGALKKYQPFGPRPTRSFPRRSR